MDATEFPLGPEPGDVQRPETWRPTGTADIVCYLAGRSQQWPGPNNTTIVEVLVESLVYRAFRYLRAPSAAFLREFPGRWGICQPYDASRIVPPALARLAEEKGLGVECRVASDDPQHPGRHWPAALRADAEEHARHWQLVEVEEGLWAGRYVSA